MCHLIDKKQVKISLDLHIVKEIWLTNNKFVIIVSHKKIYKISRYTKLSLMHKCIF